MFSLGTGEYVIFQAKQGTNELYRILLAIGCLPSDKHFLTFLPESVVNHLTVIPYLGWPRLYLRVIIRGSLIFYLPIHFICQIPEQYLHKHPPTHTHTHTHPSPLPSYSCTHTHTHTHTCFSEHYNSGWGPGLPVSDMPGIVLPTDSHGNDGGGPIPGEVRSSGGSAPSSFHSQNHRRLAYHAARPHCYSK